MWVPAPNHLNNDLLQVCPIHLFHCRCCIFELFLARSKAPSHKVSGIAEQQVRMEVNGCSYLLDLTGFVLELLDSDNHAISMRSYHRGWAVEQSFGQQLSDLISQHCFALEGPIVRLDALGMRKKLLAHTRIAPISSDENVTVGGCTIFKEGGECAIRCLFIALECFIEMDH